MESWTDEMGISRTGSLAYGNILKHNAHIAHLAQQTFCKRILAS